MRVILDFGANIGNDSIYWSQYDNIKKIVTFEPVKSNFKVLNKNIKDKDISKVEIHQLGLGEKERFAIINKKDSNNLVATSLSFVEYETDIKIVSGDSFLHNKNYSIDLLKIDAQSYEIDVLNGFAQTIKRYKPIIWVKVTLDTIKKVLDILNKYNYRIIDTFNFNILAIHETNLGNLKEISIDELIFKMLKNLEECQMNHHKFLTSEEQKNIEKSRADEFKELSEKRLSQFDYLESLVESYKSRKAVKAVDKFINKYKFIKSYLKKIFIKQTSPKPVFINLELSKSKPKKLKNIKIAVILDEFSYNSFKYEFNAITFEPSNWLEIFEKENPNLFLCESAWSGGPWQGKINFDAKNKTENRVILFDILKYCNEHEIPTIFWNKEDPINFDSFFDTAIRFDHIFTSAEECVQRYEKEVNHNSVHCLMFGAQPKLFNPIDTNERSEDIVFAGSWYGRHTQRSIEMMEIFDNILDSGFKLKIYDRFHEFSKEHPSYRFPDKYGEFINLPVPHDQIEKVYKESKYALNINTVTKSKTMFARRAFELMLCNTLVLSNYSEGMHNLFGDNVVFISKDKIDLSNSKEKRINNLYNVLKNHTYSNRFRQILNLINYNYLPDDDTITIYYIVNTQSEIDDVLEHYESIIYYSKKLVILLSDQIPNHLIKNLYLKYANDEVSLYSLHYLLNYNGVISNDTPYFIIADLQLKNDFIEKAILHYSYIETKIGIALGDKFTFKKINDINNVLFHKEHLEDAFKKMFKDKNNEFSVYTIQI